MYRKSIEKMNKDILVIVVLIILFVLFLVFNSMKCSKNVEEKKPGKKADEKLDYIINVEDTLKSADVQKLNRITLIVREHTIDLDEVDGDYINNLNNLRVIKSNKDRSTVKVVTDSEGFITIELKKYDYLFLPRRFQVTIDAEQANRFQFFKVR